MKEKKDQIKKQRWRKPEKGRDIIFSDLEMRDWGKENLYILAGYATELEIRITFLQSFFLALDQFTLKMKMF